MSPPTGTVAGHEQAAVSRTGRSVTLGSSDRHEGRQDVASVTGDVTGRADSCHTWAPWLGDPVRGISAAVPRVWEHVTWSRREHDLRLALTCSEAKLYLISVSP